LKRSSLEEEMNEQHGSLSALNAWIGFMPMPTRRMNRLHADSPTKEEPVKEEESAPSKTAQRATMDCYNKLKRSELQECHAERLRVFQTESWDAAKNQHHSKLQECRAMTARIPAMMPQRETIPRSHSGTYVPVMSTEE